MEITLYARQFVMSGLIDLWKVEHHSLMSMIELVTPQLLKQIKLSLMFVKLFKIIVELIILIIIRKVVEDIVIKSHNIFCRGILTNDLDMSRIAIKCVPHP